MKTPFVLLLAVTLVSCNQKTGKTNNKNLLPDENETIQINTSIKVEKFVPVNFNEINQLLESESKGLSAQNVMRLYYPRKAQTHEGNEKIEISEKKTENGNTLVTPFHDNQLDDSQKREKHIIELIKNKK